MPTASETAQQQAPPSQPSPSSQGSPIDAKFPHEAAPLTTPHAQHTLSQANAHGQGHGQIQHPQTRPGTPSMHKDQPLPHQLHQLLLPQPQQHPPVKVKGEASGASPTPPGSSSAKRSLPDEESAAASSAGGGGTPANKKLRVDFAGNGASEEPKPALVDVRATA